MAVCSYDQCFADSDCPGSVACNCRASASDTVANICGTGSGCRIDSDCGACGYCSPSYVSGEICDGAKDQFFCHTPKDECIDDSDCSKSNGSCNYDPTKGAFACVTLCSPPPP
ncbi:MAG: hypothetical protein ACHREM_22550 [Polyangiales bacterium]